MKILITGANGYLGKGIINELAKTDNEILAVDYRFENDIISKNNIKYFDCDLFSIENPYKYFDSPNVLLHLAWKDGFVHMSNSHINYLPKHYDFLDKITNSNIKKVAVLGSMHEIGFFEGSINENTPCNPESLYGIAKNALRKMTELMCKNKNIVLQWIRGFYIVGNTINGSSIFSKITKSEYNGEKTFPFTFGLNQFDFLDYNIFCDYILKIILQDEIDGIINCCSGRPMKLSERVEKFIKDNNYNIKLKYGAFPDRPYDSKAIWGDDYKINQILKMYENL